MGYESKVMLVDVFPNLMGTGKGYGTKICTLDLSKMGYEIGWHELFDKSMADDKFYFYQEDGNTQFNSESEDCYGEKLQYTSAQKVKDWCNDKKTIEYYTRPGGAVYREFAILKGMLNSIDCSGENMVLVHYGY